MAVVSTGNSWVPVAPPTQPTDVVYGIVTSVVGSTKIQNGSNVGTTDANGGLKITFPSAFAATPTTVVAVVNGGDYACRLAAKNATDFTVKVLQAGVNWTSGAVLGSGLNLSTGTAVTSVSGTTANNIADAAGVSSAYVSTSGGSFVSNGTLYGVLVFPYGTTTAVTAVNSATDSFTKSGMTTNSGVAVVSVSGFLTAAASVSVTIDWFAAA